MDAGGELRVALGVAREVQLVLADPAELGHEGALRRIAAEQGRDPYRVGRDPLELRRDLTPAAVPQKAPPLVGAARPHRLWLTASTLFPSGSSTNAPT